MVIKELKSAGQAEPHDEDEVPILCKEEIDTLLFHMGLESAPNPDFNGLCSLQWLWLKAQPFHNIDLLADAVGITAPLTPREAIARVLLRTGGPCHIQAISFLALLRALGFEAHLVAATIGAPNDHLLSIVQLPEGRFACDVGNGHPYSLPFPLTEELTQERCGWRFTSIPDNGGLLLFRHMPEGTTKQVYRVDLTPCRYQDFASIIHKHHKESGFGPFLVGLRAVRISDFVMLTVRDNLYQRHSEAGTTTRLLQDEDACLRVLEGPFQLGSLPLRSALQSLRAREKSPWDRLRLPLQPHKQEEIQVLMSLSTTGRPNNLERLTHSLLVELTQRTSAETRCDLLLVENSPNASHREANQRLIQAIQHEKLKIHYLDDGNYGRHIAESRTAQTKAIAAWRRDGGEAALIWMIDDDIELKQLSLTQTGLCVVNEISYIVHWLKIKRTYPEVSMCIGPITGDPPIRPAAMLHTQLMDLCANLERFALLSPDTLYLPHKKQQEAFDLPDYYYDHSREGSAHFNHSFEWLPRPESGISVREQLCCMLRSFMGIVNGKAITRPLLLGHSWNNQLPTKHTLRGGNAVFFDLDACLLHTYPSLKYADFATRRSDMIGATRLQQEGFWQIQTCGPPLLHQRRHDPTDTSDRGFLLNKERVIHSLNSEFFGVLLARIVMEPPTPEISISTHLNALAKARAERIIAHLIHATGYLERAKQWLASPPSWVADDAEAKGASAQLYDLLTELAKEALGGLENEAQALWRRILIDNMCSQHHIDKLAEYYAHLDAHEQYARSIIMASFKGG